ncbi:MAG: hypothetical protein ACHQ01_03405 [Candidatus Limnocylindrales bacterium]
MAAYRPVAAPNARAARISGTAFAVGGAFLVIGGVASVLTGRPEAAHDLAPLTGAGDIVGRFGQMAPLLAAAVAAVVAIAVAGLLALRRLHPAAAAIELLVLGVAIDVCIGGSVSRIGHATNGAVLGAAVACVMGGTAVVAGGIVGVLGRE